VLKVPAAELAFATRMRELLAPYGSVSVEYITAELQPFSNQQRPDIVFSPQSGGYARQNIFIEIKLSSKTIQDGRGFSNLVEHKVFAEEALERPLTRYLYVTSQSVPEFSSRQLLAQGIMVIDNIKNEEGLLDEMRKSDLLGDVK
jgi:hypothetical protein